MALVTAMAWVQSWPGNFYMPWVWPKKKRKHELKSLKVLDKIQTWHLLTQGSGLMRLKYVSLQNLRGKCANCHQNVQSNGFQQITEDHA